uniref:Uncharacterized protein n=2 Tax=Brassica TaxID=3705 RepID=A0A0D3AAL8_BRAOL
RPNYFYFSGLEEPKPYDIVAADPGYVRSPIWLLFWLIFRFGTPEEMRHHHIYSCIRKRVLRWGSLSGMLALTTFVGGWWLEDDFSLCITTHLICLTNDKFIDKKKKTPCLRKSKAKPKETTKNINSVSITVLFFVLLVASTEILKSEAQTFCFECGPVPFLGTNADCFNCCKTKYGSPPVVSGVVEGSEKHCHCYC